MKFSKFFSNMQESSWYREFLNPVMEEVNANSDLLDIGTGSGKMLEILYSEKNVTCVGVDTNEDMLMEAKQKLKNTNAKLRLIKANEPLDFEDNTFDCVTICNVLFHMKKSDVDNMIKDSLRLLKENGKIIVLTPTGSGSLLKLLKDFFSINNRSVYVWYRATKNRARAWSNENYLRSYSKKNKLNYKLESVLKGFAQIEVITR